MNGAFRSPLAKIANKAESTLALKRQRRRHQKSKTGVPVAPNKGHVYAKNVKKKKKSINVSGFLVLPGV